MQARHDGESACAATIWVVTRLQEIDAHLHECGVLLSSLRGPLLRAMSLPAIHRVARVSLAGKNPLSPPFTPSPLPPSRLLHSAEKQNHFNVFDHVACILTARSTIQNPPKPCKHTERHAAQRRRACVGCDKEAGPPACDYTGAAQGAPQA